MFGPSFTTKPSHHSMASTSVFKMGEHPVTKPFYIPDKSSPSSSPPPTPPKPLLVTAPEDEGDYPVLLLLHGFYVLNSFYSDLMEHIASHGFIVVAPQLYIWAKCDATQDIIDAAEVADWLPDGLPPHLSTRVKARPNFEKFALGGHSRGGKDAFGVALRKAGVTLKNLAISALIGIDPVDGLINQSRPHILRSTPNDLFDLGRIPVLVLGGSLSEIPKVIGFPACAPKGLNFLDFYEECKSPAYFFLAKDYGHMDMLNDDTTGLQGVASYCTCKNGSRRQPMRLFVGGAIVAFLNAQFRGDASDLKAIRDYPTIAPVVLKEISFRLD